MKKIIIAFIVLIIIVIAILGYYFFSNDIENLSGINRLQNIPKTNTNVSPLPQAPQDAPRIEIVAENLNTPWALAFLPNESILITERGGTIRFIDENGLLNPTPIINIPQVEEISEGGLLGIAIHPNFDQNNYVYVYYTYAANGENVRNRVVRYTFNNNTLSNPQTILDNIPGAAIHDGGRIKFGPDGYLYVATGDAREPSLAQDRNSLAGKILRITDEGKPAPDNPFNSEIYSYGHRNPQGLTWDERGRLWENEHGQSATDELNLIKAGANYGWPLISGNQTRDGMVTPVINSGSDTWAPSGNAYLNGSVYFAGLRGNALYQAVISDQSADLKEHFKGELGRIREVVAGPNGLLYVLSGNTDGRGNPQQGDDKLYRINPSKL